jgi:cytoskeleton protein RodZ
VPAAKRAGVVEVKMVFDTQSWVEVRDREDRIVFSQLNPAGAVQIVQGLPPLNVVIGNASGVRVTYNGRQVDLAPHTKIEVARLTLE